MFFDDFFGWDREFYNFERSIRDSAPYKIYRDEKEVTIIHNVLGIDEKDLNVDIKQERNGNYLVIQSSTKNDYEEYSVESRFTIDLNKYQDIKYEIKNGLLYIHLFKKEIEKPQIKITKM